MHSFVLVSLNFMVLPEITLLLDEFKTYGERLSATFQRMTARGREISTGVVYCNLQGNNQSFCPNRKATNPLDRCSVGCNCDKPIKYEFHTLNFICLLKVSAYTAINLYTETWESVLILSSYLPYTTKNFNNILRLYSTTWLNTTRTSPFAPTIVPSYCTLPRMTKSLWM